MSVGLGSLTNTSGSVRISSGIGLDLRSFRRRSLLLMISSFSASVKSLRFLGADFLAVWRRFVPCVVGLGFWVPSVLGTVCWGTGAWHLCGRVGTNKTFPGGPVKYPGGV
jgi:hypothetical protein